MRVSEFLAQYLVERGVETVFAITGAGNIRLLEAVSAAGIRFVCTHHEQAAVMAAIAAFRVSGKPGVCLFTGGPGAVNSLTGVADAFLDSFPVVVIAGQENSQYLEKDVNLRGKGIQGLNMVEIVSSFTKFAECVRDPLDLRRILDQAFFHAENGRPGPAWIEVPQDLQWSQVDIKKMQVFTQPTNRADYQQAMHSAVDDTIDLISKSERPLLWLGNGIRLAKSEGILHDLIRKLDIPLLVSWQAADLVPEDDPLYVGRAGIHGQRWANFALQNCDLLIALGTRLAIPQRGYADGQFARAAKKVIVEIDPWELAKFEFKVDVPVLGDVREFMSALSKRVTDIQEREGLKLSFGSWLKQCRSWRTRYPMAVAPDSLSRMDLEGINSYWFIERLSEALSERTIVVTDMGASLTCTHASIRLKANQRLITSTGLGEMGFGLPAAIGASIASPSHQVVLIVGEGSLMMNLQEFQTLTYLGLPLKVFLLNNRGYLTIKHTHNALFESKGIATATDPQTGVSFPDFSALIPAFGIDFQSTSTPVDLDSFLNRALGHPRAIVSEIWMPEFQELIPKSSIQRRDDGSVYSPPLEDLYPFLPREVLAKEMLVPLAE